ncbi:hypothetical protein F0562_028696 [Nyssa sinensis]|uniref:Myb/SANT-like domain-containing protein n=1 Tax=Nyssa sinensis TaxID=561372 RepID=A0A5J5B0X0_9ASTE|nr:hypothetical protein F0562_028696 [Nyssa sinensis]
MDDALIDAFYQQNVIGNKIDGTFTAKACNEVVKELCEKLGMDVNKDRVKNRLKTIKTHFNECFDLFNYGLSGFSWSPITKLWSVKPEVWKSLIEAKPKTRKWRTTPINHYDKLCEMFAKDRATSAAHGDGDHPVSDTTREELLEIIIGVGGGSSPAPAPEPLCPPPPPPPYRFESKRIELAFRVIQKFKKRITCDPNGITKTWVGPDVCNKYMGFSCAMVPDYKVKALAAVNFNRFNFSGPDLTLDGFIDELEDISIFHANSNNFTGTIPKTITKLRYFYELDLSNNNLDGKFPNDVLSATNLTFLDLRFNSFAGLVPPQVFTLDLDVLFINDNNFLQTLPDNLGSTPAIYLTLANNKFVGPIPGSIGQASKTLREVLFLNNFLSGCLPCEIGLLKEATVLDVGHNQLTGPIPHSFACLAKMELLNLAQNQFYGPVPEMVCNIPSLMNFSLSYNYFTEVGPICRKLIEKKVLDVKMNCILNLPMQRSAADCHAFFSKPKYCSNVKSLNWIPCSMDNVHNNSQEPSDRKSATTPRSYDALIPHRL